MPCFVAIYRNSEIVPVKIRDHTGLVQAGRATQPLTCIFPVNNRRTPAAGPS
jgi:hypothetical protein